MHILVMAAFLGVLFDRRRDSRCNHNILVDWEICHAHRDGDILSSVSPEPHYECDVSERSGIKESEQKMDSLLIGLMGTLFLFFLLATGVHIGVALIASGLVGLSVLTGFDVAIKMIVSAFYHKISTPALITLHLFILIGHLASGDCEYPQLSHVRRAALFVGLL